MACPAGFGTKRPIEDPQKATYSASNSSTATALPLLTLYPPLHEPDILKNILKEPIVLFISGEYAILLQWLKYGLARGSVDHSDFGARVFQRVISTVRYLNTVVFGTRHEKEAITGVVHRYHSRVRGTGDEKGEDYSADDPELHR
jgi:uncharacterized protein (DUF2236 family)